jgi:hypothetical protein
LYIQDMAPYQSSDWYTSDRQMTAFELAKQKEHSFDFVVSWSTLGNCADSIEHHTF